MLHRDFGQNAMISSGALHPDFMRRAIRVALVALVVSVGTVSYASAQQELTFSLFERYVESLRVAANIPGMSAAIVQNERVVWDSGFGFADVEHAIRARRHAVSRRGFDGDVVGRHPSRAVRRDRTRHARRTCA